MRNFSDTDLLLGSVLVLVVVLAASLPETAGLLGRVLSDAEWLLRRVW